MQVELYGQSAFRLSTGRQTVFIDPFGDMSEMAASRGLQFEYPPIEGVAADLVLVTHGHLDHNAVEAIGGSPAVLRSTAGRLESPVGEVVGVNSEHDEKAGTERGPNTIFVFELDGIRTCHFGDFGQRELREEQASAIGQVDLLFVPVGGGPTIGASRRQRSASGSVRAGSCRCTTARRGSASWRPKRSSCRGCRRPRGSTLRGSRLQTFSRIGRR